MSEERQKDLSISKASRQSFGEALAELGDRYPQVVCLDADLSKSTMSKLFAEKFPERFFEMGIQEANMIGCASGLSVSGKIPFICSFAAFLTGQFDQIRMSIAYSRANVKMIGTHCGVGIGEDGHSQMGLEDLALMRSLPGVVVLHPGDHEETQEMVAWAIEHEGPVYLRLTRQALPAFACEKTPIGQFAEYRWPKRSGRAKMNPNASKTISLFACGGLLGPATEAVEIASEGLEKKGVALRLWNASQIKPLPHEQLKSIADSSDAWISLEDHTVFGGLGSALAEWLSSFSPGIGLTRYGVQDQFGESGTPKALYEKHGFTGEKIAAKLEQLAKALH